MKVEVDSLILSRQRVETTMLKSIAVNIEHIIVTPLLAQTLSLVSNSFVFKKAKAKSNNKQNNINKIREIIKELKNKISIIAETDDKVIDNENNLNLLLEKKTEIEAPAKVIIANT